MISLPRHLAPWGPELALFPEAMSLSLGALVLPLSAVVGDGRAAAAVTGEPAGYDGIDRRGPYHRLLASEWLLADEAPDEFLRRAIASEHAFLRRAQLGEAAGRRCLVLFDAGPDQLGAPRLAHLAVLVLLAARARRQRAVLEWGVLQDPVAARLGVTGSNALELLRGRSRWPASAGDVDRWLAGIDLAPGSERWLVGGDRLARLGEGRGARAVRIEDVIDPDGPPRLRVAVDGEAHPREVVLEVPAERAAVQLLRDPFGAATPPRRSTRRNRSELRLDPESSLVFAPDGRRLYVRSTGAEVLGLHVPNSPNAAPGAPSVFRPPEGETAIAVGRSSGGKRHALVVTRSELDGAHLLHTLSRRGEVVRSQRFEAGPGEAGRSPRPDLVPLVALTLNRFAVHFIDPSGALVQLRDGRTEILDRGAARALAPRATSTCLAWINLRAGIPRVVRAFPEAGELLVREEMEVRGAPPMHRDEAVFGGGSDTLFAYPTSSTSWRLVERLEAASLEVPADHTVVAVLRARQRRALVVLDPTRTRALVIGPDERRLVVLSASPIRAVAVAPTYADVAFATRAGEATVYSAERERVTVEVGRSP